MDFTFGENTFCTGVAHTSLHHREWDAFLCAMRYWRFKLRPATNWQKLSATPWMGFFELAAGATQRTKPCIAKATDGIAFDIDAPGWDVARLDNRLDPFRRLYYTTTKSRHAHQRWRVVLECDRYKTIEEQEALWRALNVILDSEVDQQTKDCTRLHYVPAIWDRADNSWEERDGIKVPVDALIAVAPPPPEPVLRVTRQDGTIEQGEVSVLAGNQPPPNDPVITDKMLARHGTGQRGGRMWKLLVGAACRYKLQGWALTDQQLFDAACRANTLISGGAYRHDLLRECGKALAYAEAFATERENPQPKPQDAMTPLERYRAKLQYHLSHSKVTI